MKYAVLEIAELARKAFPIITMDDTEKLKEAIRLSYPATDDNKKYITDRPITDYPMSNGDTASISLVQGDIISGIPFLYTSTDGEIYSYKSCGILLSNTCDSVREDNLLIAPFRSLDEIIKPDHKSAILSNQNYSYMYIPNNKVEIVNSFIDFGRSNSINRELLTAFIEKGKSHRICSLTALGYYSLIVKLSIFIARAEDYDVLSYRKAIS
jgi:hypothetical protein